MGSENSPLVLFHAVLKSAIDFPCLNFLQFVDKSAFEMITSHTSFLSTQPAVKARLQFFLVDEVILMMDEPLVSIRKKKKSSLIQGLVQLKEKSIQAFVTSGNTGALIAGAALLLPRIRSVKRPALLANLPTISGKVSLIDVGGNVACRASHLIQFAQMGVAYHQFDGIQKLTRVGLLNVGVESQKGTAEIRKVYDFFNQNHAHFSQMEFIGNVEGDEVFQGGVDVLITDGFSGNVLLKTAEGVYSLISQQLEKTLTSFPPDLKKTVFHSLRSQFDREEHRGAIVCGVEGVIVKCHGGARDQGVYHGICGAIELVEHNFIEKIKAFV